MKTLFDLFWSFENRGEKIALVHRTGVRRFEYSYGWLFDQGLKMADFLASRGIEKGDPVVLWAPNSPFWAGAFWGILARGAVVVPVDFMAEKQRAEKIATLVKAKLVIQSQFKLDRLESGSDSDFNSNADYSRPRTILIEELFEKLDDYSSDKNNFKKKNPARSGEDDLAEIVYTSGTTGDPKGVELRHKNLLSNAKQVDQYLPVTREHWRFLSVLPLSHTFEQTVGFLVPLLNGASVVYLRTIKPTALLEALRDEDVYVMITVPRLLLALKNAVELELQEKNLGRIFAWILEKTENQPRNIKKKIFFPIQRKFGQNFKTFVSGAAALDQSTARFWSGLGFRVIEGYGITECSPVVAANEYEEQVFGTVGRVLPGVKVRLENQEILVTGDNVFSGYYQNAEASNEVFERDQSGRRWFKTGDMGELDAENRLRIKGRKKEMIVTSSGVNVYPDDLEPILNEFPEVKEACVVGIDSGEGEEVHAVLILNDSFKKEGGIKKEGSNSKEIARKVIQKANEKLDALNEITDFSIWNEDEFPKTTTMKIQKFKVKQEIQNRKKSTQESAEPTGSGDQLLDKIRKIIAKVTAKPISKVKADSILVADLGLTSIGRLELVNHLEQDFRLDLEDSAIDQKTTVAELREMVAKRGKVKAKTKSRIDWPHSFLAKAISRVLDIFVHMPLVWIFAKIEVKGRENLERAEKIGPVMFTPNHVSYLDSPVFYLALPPRIRYNLSAAAYEGLFLPDAKNPFVKIAGRLWFEYLTLAGRIVQATEGQNFRGVLRLFGRLADRKVNLLFFPEGQRSDDAQLLPFKPGLGLVIKELQIPVVPVKIRGTEKMMPRGSAWIKPGKVTVTFGKPMIFKKETPSEILQKTQAVLREL